MDPEVGKIILDPSFLAFSRSCIVRSRLSVKYSYGISLERLISVLAPKCKMTSNFSSGIVSSLSKPIKK